MYPQLYRYISRMYFTGRGLINELEVDHMMTWAEANLTEAQILAFSQWLAQLDDNTLALFAEGGESTDNADGSVLWVLDGSDPSRCLTEPAEISKITTALYQELWS